MLLHVFNGWPAAHKRPEVLQFITPSGKHAEALSDEDRESLQWMILEEPWCTLKSVQSVGFHVLKTFVEKYWNMEHQYSTFGDEILDEILEISSEKQFQFDRWGNFEDNTDDYTVSIDHYSVRIQSATEFYEIGHKESDEDEGEDDVEGLQAADLISTALKPQWMLVPPVTKRSDNPSAYDSWVSAFCAWDKMLSYLCQSSTAWKLDQLMSCSKIAIENKTTPIVQSCLRAYKNYNPPRHPCDLDTLHNGFLLRMKDLCMILGRWDYLWFVISDAHEPGAIPRNWFSEDEVQAMLVAIDHGPDDPVAKELARHFRKDRIRRTCECKGRRFND